MSRVPRASFGGGAGSSSVGCRGCGGGGATGSRAVARLRLRSGSPFLDINTYGRLDARTWQAKRDQEAITYCCARALGTARDSYRISTTRTLNHPRSRSLGSETAIELTHFADK